MLLLGVTFAQDAQASADVLADGHLRDAELKGDLLVAALGKNPLCHRGALQTGQAREVSSGCLGLSSRHQLVCVLFGLIESGQLEPEAVLQAPSPTCRPVSVAHLVPCDALEPVVAEPRPGENRRRCSSAVRNVSAATSAAVDDSTPDLARLRKTVTRWRR